VGAGAVAVLVPPDAELAVVRLLRSTSLEDDHRGDRVRLAEVRDVEALDADGNALEPERLLERRERLHALLAPVLPAQLVLGERQVRVLLRKLPQATQVAARGHPH